MLSRIVCLAVVFTTLAFSEEVEVYSSCGGLEDGEYYLKLESDNAVTVKAICSNEYAIIDVNKDENWLNYFSTYQKWHHSVYGPQNGDNVNWLSWFEPSSTGTMDDSSFSIAPDCSSCLDESYTGAYYMTGSMFQAWWILRGLPMCDMDFEDYTCRACETDSKGLFYVTKEMSVDDVWNYDTLSDGYLSFGDNGWSGSCSNSLLAADQEVLTDHMDCQVYSTKAYKPSLGSSGRHCVCYKSETETTATSSTENIDVEVEEEDDDDDDSEEEEEEDVTVELYQSDFVSGTYRITKPGTYTVMEDIEFNFNDDTESESTSDNGIPSYNAETDDGGYSWFPNANQQEDYEGAGDYQGPYFMGFFAGITVECANVVLDLNGFELKMSKLFWNQQRYFAIIELANQPFMPSQGPGLFGASPSSANGVVIKNGVLGLSSHHGIHSNRASNIEISDLVVRHFETHGMQINGFENLQLNNVEIGPSQQEVGLEPNYWYGRLMLPRMRYLADLLPDKTISFRGDTSVEYTMQDLVDELEFQMDLALHYVMTGTVPSSEDILSSSSWESAISLFLNHFPYPQGGSMYGLFFNYYGASVLGYHFSDKKSSNLQLNNVYIHDIYHSGEEVVRFSCFECGPSVVTNPFGGTIGFKNVFGDDATVDDDEFSYVGDTLIDAYVAVNQWSSDAMSLDSHKAWGTAHLLQLLLGDVDELAMTGTLPDGKTLMSGCNSDAMIHSMKGLMGIRIDGVDGVSMDNVRIENLVSMSDLGEESLCGSYTERFSGGHFTQDDLYFSGYGGTYVQGISLDAATDVSLNDVSINHLYSKNGPTFGIHLYYGNEFTSTSGIAVSHLHAGFGFDEDTYTFDSRPNIAPEACAIREKNTDSFTDYSRVDLLKNSFSTDSLQTADIDVSCVTGHISCLDTYGDSMYGDVNDDVTCEYSSFSEVESFASIASSLTTSALASISSNDESASSAEENYSFMFLMLVGLVASVCFGFYACRSYYLYPSYKMLNTKDDVDTFEHRSSRKANFYGSV